jgi:hypothetical protein
MARHDTVGLFGSVWDRSHLCGIVRTQNNQALGTGLDMVPLVQVSAGPWSWLGPGFGPITCPESQHSPYAGNPTESGSRNAAEIRHLCRRIVRMPKPLDFRMIWSESSAIIIEGN